MSFLTYLITFLIALTPSISGAFGIQAVVGGKRFTAALKPSQAYCHTFYLTARSRHGDKGTELQLRCAAVVPGGYCRAAA